jgi:glycerate kinase
MITRSRDIQPALGHLEAALEETCATLMALESARAAGGEGAAHASAIQGQISRAIACVRNAMSELRAMHDVETSMVAYGFVLADPEWSRVQARRRQTAGGQDRPRRTA